MQKAIRRRVAATAVAVGLVGSGSAVSLAPASATVAAHTRATSAARTWDGDGFVRYLEVQFARTHWNWTAWNDSTPVAFGSSQPDYQCAEFVARSLAAAGLIPGLGPNDPQDSYFNYTAPNGKTYDLLLITPLPQYNTIYDFLMDSGLATDVGDDPADAQPGDMVVTYLGYQGEASHMGLIDTPQITASDGTITEPTLDAHNNARLQYGYHYYAPSHLVKLVPNAYAEVWTWAAEQWALHGTPPSSSSTKAPSHVNGLVRIPGAAGRPQV